MPRPYVGPAVHLRLSDELFAAVDEAAAAADVSRAVMIRRLLARALGLPAY